MFTRIMDNLFSLIETELNILFIHAEKRKSRHYSNTIFSLALKSQLCRNTGCLESRSYWQVGGGGGNLFNGKLMRP